MNVIDWVMAAAKVPSFSSYEERIHPLVRDAALKVPDAKIEIVADNNLIVTVPGKRKCAPIALAAHLDKINHYGENLTTDLPIVLDEAHLTGQLDDATGVGILLHILEHCSEQNFPPLQFLFSEIEENIANPALVPLLRNGGEGLYHGIGAQRLSRHLLATNRVPAMVVTIDTTPFFKGTPGVALYSRHWELNNLDPSPELTDKTIRLEAWFTTNFPEVVHRNNTNDYLEFGKLLNEAPGSAIPSIAIEPAIFPYHCSKEGVFVQDIELVETIAVKLLTEYME